MYRLLKTLRSHPAIVLIAILLISLGFIYPLKTNTHIETNLDKYMPQNNPAFIYSNQAEEWFSIHDGIIIAVENPQGIYQTETLEKVKEITQKLQEMKEIDATDITSLSTADNITGSDYGLEVEPFFTHVPSTEKQLKAVQEAVEKNEMVFHRIVSADEKVTLIIATIHDDSFSQAFYQRILDLAQSYEGPEKIYVAGRPIVEGSLASLASSDMAKMVPLVIITIVLVLLLVMQSFMAMILTLFVVLCSVLWSFGLMSALNIPIYAVSTMLPVMLIAIGVADGIHLFSHLRHFKENHPEANDKTCILDMLQLMWKPVIMTSVTTAIGFLSLLTSEVYPVKYFGLFAAFGVLVAMCLSLSLIPAGITLFGLPRWKRPKKNKTLLHNSSFSEKFTLWILNHATFTMMMTVTLVIVSLWGTSKIWIDSSFLSQFEQTSNIAIADTFINDHFGGTSTMNVIFDANEEDTFKNPRVLMLMDELQNDVEHALPVVGNSFSIVDYLKRMNMVMHADNMAYNVIPDSQELVAQYLLLYEMSGDPDNLLKVVDYPYQKANMTFQLKNDSSLAIQSAIDIIEKYQPQFEELGIHMKYAGSGYRSLVFTDLILKGQIYSIFISLAIVILLISLMFKNVIIGLIGVIPSFITVCISFGLMGLFNIPLDTTTALLSSIAIGMGVDYAIHYLEMYKIYARETNDPQKAMIMAIKHSGTAILFNALVVIAGFMVLMFSSFPPNRTLGFLVSLNMFTSFIGTLTIMAYILVQSHIFIHKEISHE
ncbi:MAG: MMPL family transporter [Spirochaetia bacterium]|jgi:predicted RND superfamily exporter protein|nr:MMPL family transporter [Spirochaetia bacterium]